MSDIKSKVLKKIQDGEVNKIPRWQILVKRWLIGMAFVATVLIGGIAMALILHNLAITDLSLAPKLGRGQFGLLLELLPYFWLVVFGLMMALAVSEFRRIGKGYRYSLVLMVVVNILITGVLGVVLFLAGLGPKLDRAFHNVPFYDRLGPPREELWNRPDIGAMGGVLLEEWQFETFKGDVFQLIDENGELRGEHLMEIGNPMKIFGEMRERGLFELDEVRPWDATFLKEKHPVFRNR